MYPFTLEESGNELSECFRRTKRIKWNWGPWIAHLHNNHMEIFETFRLERKFGTFISKPAPFICVWLPMEKVTEMDYQYVCYLLQY